jgi:acyl-coenzyme A thioesterase PaaI-like protein
MSERHELDPYVFGREQRCFGCGPHNDVGLRLRFVREGDEVVTSWTPRPGYEGPPNVMHGGLQATLADEVAGWALVGLLGRMGFTTSLDVRFVRPVRIDREVQARAKIASRSGSIVTLHVTLRQDGKTTAMGRVSYMLPDEEKATAYLGGDLPESWAHLFRDAP